MPEAELIGSRSNLIEFPSPANLFRPGRHEVIKRMPHVAFEVDDVEEALFRAALAELAFVR